MTDNKYEAVCFDSQEDVDYLLSLPELPEWVKYSIVHCTTNTLGHTRVIHYPMIIVWDAVDDPDKAAHAGWQDRLITGELPHALMAKNYNLDTIHHVSDMRKEYG